MSETVFTRQPHLSPLSEEERVEILQDMLQLLKESVSSRHSERLEQIVIILIGLEISSSSRCLIPSEPSFTDTSPPVLGIITILVDLLA